MDRIWFVLGGLAGLSAVALSAVAAHMPMDAAGTAMLRDAVQMQGWHALALLCTGIFASRAGWLGHAAGLAFALGTVGFCGSIYARVFFSIPATFLAPYGGCSLMLGWGLLAAAGLRRQ